MMFGPATMSLPPSSMPGMGSMRYSMPGSSLPTAPGRLCMGVFMVSAGAVSVAP